ncbi:hypothetical protein C1645_748682 [Glomus cerebriforme]|uniref:F-box domain-containing protein n=1 Tax=Glomus cerebriforme TaxID=658196 RepID=A0A397TLQ8_9GLOM|nr:hypothetical protein C1645_748682 [Glomus cerebriforme]
MQSFADEIKIDIFKYVDYPLNLTLTCRNWSIIAKDSHAKTEWLIVKYGKENALFHAVSLGPTFIDIPVCQALIARKVTISRYFIQKLIMHFGKYDQKLIQLKLEHNVGQQNIRSSYASDLPVSVFIYLLNEGSKQLSQLSAETSNANDIQSSHVITPSNDMDFLWHGYQTRLTVFPVFTNNIGILGTRPSRNINQRRRIQRRQRNTNRIYTRRVRLDSSINNEDILDRIAKLPRQITNNNPLIDQFYNGSPFI